jgi:hypothetical protein
MPIKKLLWDWQMGLAQKPQQAAHTNNKDGTAAAAAAAAAAGAAPPPAPAPEAAAAEAAAAAMGVGPKGAEVQSRVTAVKEVTVQNPQGEKEKYVVIEETKHTIS